MDLTSQQMHHDAQIKESSRIRNYHPMVGFSSEVSHWPLSNSRVKRLSTCEAQRPSTPASWSLLSFNSQGFFAAFLFIQSLWKMQSENEPGMICWTVSWPGGLSNRDGTQSCSLRDLFSFLTTIKISVHHHVKSEYARSKIRLFGSFRQWSNGYHRIIKF